MKKLICVKDVEAMGKQKQKVIFVDRNTIITPAARDTARTYGMEFSYEENNCKSTTVELPKAYDGEIDSNMIYTVVKALVEKGLLKDLFDKLPLQPYIAECDNGGLKVVRGDSVRFDVYDTGKPDNKVFYQELISNNRSSTKAGLLTIENSSYERETKFEEIDYIIEGTTTIEINGKTFTACPGDIVYVPSGSKVVWSSPDKAKLFYTTSPVN